MASYWIFDNVDTLRKLRIIRQERGKLEQNGKIFWMASLILHIWLDLRIVFRCKYRRAYVQSQMDMLQADSEYKVGLSRKLTLLDQKSKFAKMGLGRCVADIFACLKDLSR